MVGFGLKVDSREAKTKVELEPAGTAKRFNENSLPVRLASVTGAEGRRVMVQSVDVNFQRISHQLSVLDLFRKPGNC